MKLRTNRRVKPLRMTRLCEISCRILAPLRCFVAHRLRRSQPKPGQSVAAKVMTPPPSTATPPAGPVTAQPAPISSVGTAPPADPALVNSAAQHVFLQPQRFRLKHFLILMVLGLAAVLVAGVGYLKYQSFRRMRIENAVNEKLNSAPSLTLRKAALRVLVTDTREVILDGNVSSPEDFTLAEALASSVPGVSGVTNRVTVIPGAVPAEIPANVPPGVSPNRLSP